jgi:hypothetical protein
MERENAKGHTAKINILVTRQVDCFNSHLTRGRGLLQKGDPDHVHGGSEEAESERDN